MGLSNIKKNRRKFPVIAVINFALGIITFPFLYMTAYGFLANTIKMFMHGSDNQLSTTIYVVSIELLVVCLLVIGFFQFLLFKESKKKLKTYIKSDFIGYLLGSAVASLYFGF